MSVTGTSYRRTCAAAHIVALRIYDIMTPGLNLNGAGLLTAPGISSGSSSADLPAVAVGTHLILSGRRDIDRTGISHLRRAGGAVLRTGGPNLRGTGSSILSSGRSDLRCPGIAVLGARRPYLR